MPLYVLGILYLYVVSIGEFKMCACSLALTRSFKILSRAF